MLVLEGRDTVNRRVVLGFGSSLGAGFAALLIMGISTAGPIVQSLRALRQVVMVNPKVGWAIAGQRIVRTTDGGQRWTVVGPTAPVGTSSALAGVTLQHVALAISGPTGVPLNESPGYSTLLWATSDSGTDWHYVAVPLSILPVQSLQLLGSGIGWALTDIEANAGNESAVLLHTANGGKTWQALLSSVFPGHSVASTAHGIPYAEDKAGLSFLSTHTGWVTGGGEAPGTLLFLRTTNGGQSFSSQTLPPPSGYVIGNADPPIFPTATVGWTPVTLIRRGQPSPSGLGFELTTNAGITWNAVPKVFPEGVYSGDGTFHQPAWSLVGSRYGWVLAEGQLNRTVDAGRQWQRIAEAPMMKTWVGIDFVSRQIGWAFGTGKTVLWKTIDGGQRWSPVSAWMN